MADPFLAGPLLQFLQHLRLDIQRNYLAAGELRCRQGEISCACADIDNRIAILDVQ